MRCGVRDWCETSREPPTSNHQDSKRSAGGNGTSWLALQGWLLRAGSRRGEDMDGKAFTTCLKGVCRRRSSGSVEAGARPTLFVSPCP